ncbi:two-component response regulator [Gracilibacillus boraciitolerans JCM 21714]|uniref:Two-component response regulator n=1 Tax=Gracilibacillus boraciitolerans JCM 21714 TaxID=1298598 RepID=W4VNR9_9BACI|nr:helix-turn-helix domain-containing protein [Gracilibacillus boraciitolerans]GAE94816.1 two-component response regulator [Gracilibacillus boraciitolerans JCM 21714]
MNVQTPNELEDMFYNFIKIFKELEPSNNSLVVYKAISLIKDKYEEGISLKEIANELNVTPEYLSSLFNKETGKSFTLYLKQLRIHKAQEYLTKSEMKSYEIGEKIGYTDPKYFTKVFKEITGITPPATYKKLNKTK